ncbi:hypothetical protein SAMN00120144_0798 [Hymenobacter roseosalivarius DSM 11622]|uniref:DUF4783 domain-containing protein n=1 Tax=Hymenobacter roseosalivarius DSM 11622 TaxID=645990 RepID=A0A1W1USB1_9BACT|nr:DUF4783 domain-containing protein [Hymenobacter roseosalivarius]SMB84015.1 hypothetical protein SAMN00120144_0798 [Hymenobacter roseosalivarius DSM 11622]
MISIILVLVQISGGINQFIVYWHSFGVIRFVLSLYMRRNVFRACLLVWLGLLSIASYAQSETFGAVRGAIRNGSAQELAPYLGAKVEVGYDGDKNSYSAAEAESVLKNFFTKNPPAAFDFIHQGSSNEGTKYAIGKYTGKNGTYRVFVKMKPGSGSPTIDTIDFTQE